MFDAWGRRVFQWRWRILTISGLFLAASLMLVIRGGTLSAGSIGSIEAERGLRIVERELSHPGDSSFTIIFENMSQLASDPAFQSEVQRALEPLRHDARISTIHGPFDGDPPYDSALVSHDEHRAIAMVGFRDEYKVASRYYPEVRARIHAPHFTLIFTGNLAFRSDLDTTLERDLLRAEIVSMPLALIVLLLVFGTLVASSVPVGVGGLAVVGGVAAVFALSRVQDVAQYSLNVVTLIGLGVAIDYSLFVVTRYRENLERGLSVEDSVAHAVATAGRAVAFSGVAVAIGLSGLFFYRGSFLSSIGLGGAIVVALAVLYGLTFLPALLAVLGHRINYGRILRTSSTNTDGFWHSIAMWVMRRPIAVLIPTLALMLTVGSPFLKLRLAGADISALPTSAEARRGYELLQREFPDQTQTRVVVLAQFASGAVLSPDRVGALYDLSRRVAGIPNVERVQSIVDLDPGFQRADYQAMLPVPALFFGGILQTAIHESVGAHIAVFSVLTRAAPASEEARNIVRAIRTHRQVGDGTLLVTGQTALDLDETDFILSHTPAAVAFVMIMTYLVLFFLLGSVILPLKAVLMNLLSITGSFGALVWIFQEGHLGGILGISPAPIEPSLPIILFCAVFGLSMDYEVLLLSRMQEEYRRTGDNTRAVAEGLERSGRLITSAAAIMVAVFVAFALAKVVLIKAVGLGMAVAVALDATIVRVLIVPSTMRLFGDLNWWSPKPLMWLYERVGFFREKSPH